MGKPFRQRLKAFAKRVGEIQAFVILSLFYFVLLAPVALLFRLFADPLQLRKTQASLWRTRDRGDERLEWGRAQ